MAKARLPVNQARRCGSGPPGLRLPWATLTIDGLVPGWISTDRGIAGVNLDGSRSTDFASVTALTKGAAGDRLVRLASDIARRYEPDAVDLTELMFDKNTFGGDDLAVQPWHGRSGALGPGRGNRADSGQDYALLAQAAARLVLAEQSIGVFVGSSLPWAGGVAEVDVHVGGETECAVLGHFRARGSLFVPLTAYRRIGMFEA
jgi:hypothetical protein